MVAKNKKINPIDSITDVNRIREFLSNHPRDLLLFDMITQTGLDLSNILRLKVGDLDGVKIGDDFPLDANHFQYDFSPIVTPRIVKTFQVYKKSVRLASEDFLFKSQNSHKALTALSVSRLVRNWFSAIGLKGLTGVRSLKKTWEVHFRDQSGAFAIRGHISLKQNSLGVVAVPSLGNAIYEKLFSGILIGEIAPKTRLYLKKLAEEMKVSTIPVRDALNRLEANGLVVVQKNRSYLVNWLSKERLAEITKMRLLMEPYAAREGFINYTTETIGKMREAHEIIVSLTKANYQQNVDKIMALNHEFHFELYRQSRMPLLIEMLESLWQRISPYKHIYLKENTDWNPLEGAYRHHEWILSGLKKKDCKLVIKGVKGDIKTPYEFNVNYSSTRQGEAGLNDSDEV